jgi:uncharacterized protein YuzE
MRLTYDPDVDAAYVYLVDQIRPGGVARTVPVDSLPSQMVINLDFDASDRLLGVEILDASRVLPPELLGRDGPRAGGSE